MSKSVLRRLTLSSKFSILGIAALLMTGLPTALYVRQTLAEIATANLEAQGTAPVMALQRVVQLTQQHRDLAAGALTLNEKLAVKRPQTRDALALAIEEVDTRLEASGASAQVISQWVERKQRWTALEKGVATHQLKPRESAEQHTQLIADLLALSATMLDEFGLSLDPQADSHALITSAFANAPELAEKLGQMRAQGTGFLATGTISSEGRILLTVVHGRVHEIHGDMMGNLGKAGAANAELKHELSTKEDMLNTQITKALLMADQGLINATDLKLPYNEYFQEYTSTIDSVYEFNALASRKLVKLLDARVHKLRLAQVVTLGILLAMLAAFMTLSLAFVRRILGQLGAEPDEASSLAQSVAAGDLSVHIELKPGDGTSLMAQLKAMQESLAKVVSNVRKNAESVATGSALIAQGNNDLSGRTEEQASVLEEAAAAMDQLGVTVKQNADTARQADQLARSASSEAVKGGEVVGQVVDTMRGINDSSKKIADIIGVIDSIAFQTNILALNAAVEAARAGEQGRGFAVVASEVRKLAGRSAEAAKDIKSLISASVERVAQGSALVDKAGMTMTEIVSSIKRVTDMVAEISSASTEQSSGVAQVGESVGQMDRATQQNAALVEQSAAAAETLKQQAHQLVQAVSVFKLGQDCPAGH